MACVEHENIDLAILDVMLPDIDGFEILKQIRLTHNFPVIMLTAKTEYMDKITGLTLGADDYIPKPFNPLELVARVKAQIRRYTQYNEGTKDEGDVIDFGGLFLNRQSHECTYNEVPLTLTPSLIFCGCSVRTEARLLVLRSYSTRFGRKNAIRTATIRSWFISGICGKK